MGWERGREAILTGQHTAAEPTNLRELMTAYYNARLRQLEGTFVDLVVQAAERSGRGR
ncbi:hypothetical protein GCM10020218_103410 [Dactylosporangium vinaceum]